MALEKAKGMAINAVPQIFMPDPPPTITPKPPIPIFQVPGVVNTGAAVLAASVSNRGSNNAGSSNSAGSAGGSPGSRSRDGRGEQNRAPSEQGGSVADHGEENTTGKSDRESRNQSPESSREKSLDLDAESAASEAIEKGGDLETDRQKVEAESAKAAAEKDAAAKKVLASDADQQAKEAAEKAAQASRDAQASAHNAAASDNPRDFEDAMRDAQRAESAQLDAMSVQKLPMH
jgi:colicin import membrane protein